MNNKNLTLYFYVDKYIKLTEVKQVQQINVKRKLVVIILHTLQFFQNHFNINLVQHLHSHKQIKL